MSLFGGGGAQIALNNHSISDVSAGGACGASFLLNNDGTADFLRTVGTDGTYAGEWVASGPISPAVAALYEVAVAVTVTAGSLGGSGGGTFNLGTNRTWTVSAGAGGNSSATLNMTIRYAGGGATLATATITLSADGRA